MTLEQMRAKQARDLSRYYAGETDRHPQGELARRYLLPTILGKDCSDAKRVEFSEWGHAAGFTFD